MHSVHMKRVCSNIAKDCAGKSILVQKHLLIIAYGQIALLMAWLNLVWQVSFVYLTEEKFLFPVWQPECQLSVKESSMTAAAVSFIRFSLFVDREISHTSVKHPESISNTQVRGFCLLCPPPILHIKNGDWGCFLNQNPPTYKLPRWAGLFTFFSSPREKTKKMETLFESLKGSSFSIKETKRGGMRKKRGK